MPPNARAYRLTAIDALRGLAIVIMAIDHVRDYFMTAAEQDPMADPNITMALFATRWITHFCAPAFVLLAGVSAGLMAPRKSPSDLTRFLLTRGLWLILIEVTLVSLAWTFAPFGVPEMQGKVVLVFQVIWAIGAGMVVLSLAHRFGRRLCLAAGLFIVATHNLLDAVWPPATILDLQWPAWATLHARMSLVAGPFWLFGSYPVLPWIGVILLGFGISGLFELPEQRRNSILIRAGVALTVGFLLLRASGIYGDPNPWQTQPGGATATFIDFLNVTKYPPSLLFLMMTWGPAAIVCAYANRIPTAARDVLTTFGRAPFAFYVAHLYLIHLLSVALGIIQGFPAAAFMTISIFYPRGYGLGLPGVYAAWILVVALLYPLCRWVASVKSRRRDWWLSFV